MSANATHAHLQKATKPPKFKPDFKGSDANRGPFAFLGKGAKLPFTLRHSEKKEFPWQRPQN